MLYIVTSYHRIQSQGKRRTQTQENDKNPHFGLDLDLLDPNSSHHFFIKQSFRHCSKLPFYGI